MDKFEKMLGQALDDMVDEEMEIRERERESYNKALEDFETYAQKWADRQECIGRSVVKLVVKELIDSAKELKK